MPYMLPSERQAAYTTIALYPVSSFYNSCKLDRLGRLLPCKLVLKTSIGRFNKLFSCIVRNEYIIYIYIKAEITSLVAKLVNIHACI